MVDHRCLRSLRPSALLLILCAILLFIFTLTNNKSDFVRPTHGRPVLVPHPQLAPVANHVPQQSSWRESQLEAYAKFRRCIETAIHARNDQDFWRTGQEWGRLCERELPDIVSRIEAIKNKDELKFNIMPPGKGLRDCTLVSMGIGHDVVVEEYLKGKLPNCDFFGVDPIADVNEELFTKIGTFYPFALANHSGQQTASVLETKGDAVGLPQHYQSKRINHVEMGGFLRVFINRDVIYQILMDIEGGEYGTLDYFIPGGRLDKLNITVCQLNAEVHGLAETADKQAYFKNWMQATVKYPRYACIKQEGSWHLRLFCYNYLDEACIPQIGLNTGSSG